MQRSGSGQPSLRRAHQILDVPAHADAHQLARAYRRQARRFHPDLSVETDATERFWALQAAYRVALDALRSTVPPTPVVHDPARRSRTMTPSWCSAFRPAAPSR